MRWPRIHMLIAVLFFFIPSTGNASEICVDYSGTAPLVDYQRFDEVRSPVSLGRLVMFLAREDGDWSLRIVDAESSSPLRVLGELAFSHPWQMWVRSGYLFVLEGRDLVIVDVGNPASPYVVTRMVDVGEVQGVDVYGDYLYVANHWQSLLIYDISETAQPQLVTDLIIERDYVYDVIVRDGYLVVRSSQHLAVYALDDLSSPSPSPVAALPLPGRSHSMIGYENYLLVGISEARMAVVDLSDPAHPLLAGVVDTGIAQHRSPQILGDRLLICDQRVGLQVLSLANLPQIDRLETITFADDPWSATVAAGMAVVNNQNETLQFLDLDSYTPREPIVESSPLANRMWNLRYEGNLIYGIHGLYNPRGLFVLELDELGGLTEVGRWSSPNIIHSEITGDLALLAGGLTLQFLDLSNPKSPDLIGEVSLGGGRKRIAIDGHFAYISHEVGGGASSSGDFISLVDFSDPRTPVVIGTSPGLGFRVDGLQAHKGIVYAASGEAGLAIYMIGQGREGNKPALQFKHLGTVSLPGWPFLPEFQLRDGLAYIVSYDALHIVDCRNPRKARLLSTLYSPLANILGGGMVLKDDRAYINSLAGVLVANITDPAQPGIEGYLETGQASFSLVEVEGYLVSVTVDGMGLSMYPQCTSADEGPPRGRDRARLHLNKSSGVNTGLQAVYPIPANPSVTFKYDLGEAVSGGISIYDLRGRRVYDVLLSSAAGEIQWNGTDQTGRGVASGVYFVKLRWGGEVQVNRFSLVR